MGTYLINLYSNGVHKVLKVDDIEQLHKDINKDTMIKYQMADIGILMVTTFAKWLSPIFIAVHTANHTEGFATTKSSKQEELKVAETLFEVYKKIP